MEVGHSRHATGSPLHNEGSSTSKNTKTNGSLPAKIEKPKKEDREKGWTTVVRKRRGSRANLGVRKAEIVDGRASPPSGPHPTACTRAGVRDGVRCEISRGGSGIRVVQKGPWCVLCFALFCSRGEGGAILSPPVGLRRVGRQTGTG